MVPARGAELRLDAGVVGRATSGSFLPMPIFRMDPVVSKLTDPVWANSPVHETCWVHAADEAEARGMASARFLDARATIPGKTSAESPWRDESLVDASLTEETPAGMTIPYGTVVSGAQA